jgi:protein ImuB
LIRSDLSAPADAPLVVAEPIKGALRLAAINDAAAQLGLTPGMALADARAMHPRIAVADADPAADRRMLIALADWCDRYTPLVGLDAPDGLVLDITGCAHLFGGEEALRHDLVARLEQHGFHTRAAAADTVGCAWAMARYGAARPIPTHQTRDVLLPLPLAALRISAKTVTALAQVGLKRIADVIDRPRAPLAARFGEDFVRRIDQATGQEDEPITPRLPVPPYLAERRFADPIAREADVLGTIEQLAHELAKLLERRGEGARLIEAALFRTDGKVHRIAAGTGAPLRDAARIRALFVERLAAIGDECDPGFGYDTVRLSAHATERCDPSQTGLTAPDHAAELAHLIDRLGARFGLRRITRLVPQDTHIPEHAIAAVAAAASCSPSPTRGKGSAYGYPPRPEERANTNPPLQQETERARLEATQVGFTRLAHTRCRSRVNPRSGGGPMLRDASQRQSAAMLLSMRPSAIDGDDVSGHTLLTQESLSQDSLTPTRPIRLFERPEPIEAIAEVPDGPPVQFTWRRVRYAVAHAEGPERIAMEWWRDPQGQALTRDYFRVESDDGVRVWLYREGLFSERSAPNWFLHGVFA